MIGNGKGNPDVVPTLLCPHPTYSCKHTYSRIHDLIFLFTFYILATFRFKVNRFTVSNFILEIYSFI